MTVNDISYQIRGAIFSVYNTLGPGLLECVYEEALIYELQKRGMRVQSQVAVPIVYDGHPLRSELRLDLLVEDTVVVEIKSVAELKDVFFKQLTTYLKLTHKPLGLLVNFNTEEIARNILRVANTKSP